MGKQEVAEILEENDGYMTVREMSNLAESTSANLSSAVTKMFNSGELLRKLVPVIVTSRYNSQHTRHFYSYKLKKQLPISHCPLSEDEQW